jgi:adenosylmethionine-8-amino-7-oxononanoate aminotransferase
MTTQKQLQEKDFQYLWHPFTQTAVWREVDPLVIERGEGVYLFDVDGRRYLDGVSALWCNVHGHGVPELVAAIQQQAGLLCHSTLLGLTHRPIIELSEALAQHLPLELRRMFFSDSGTAAVEASLRMAIEYWHNVGGDAARQRRHFASLEDAYHGDTLGAIGVGFSPTFHSKLSSVVVPSLQLATPSGLVARGVAPEVALDVAVDGAKKFFAEHGAQLAAFIVEPLVQGAAGIRPYPKEFLREIAALCRSYGVLLIADEVATGLVSWGRCLLVSRRELSRICW